MDNTVLSLSVIIDQDANVPLTGEEHHLVRVQPQKKTTLEQELELALTLAER